MTNRLQYFLSGVFFGILTIGLVWLLVPNNTPLELDKLNKSIDSLEQINSFLEMDIKQSNLKLKKYEALQDVLDIEHEHRLDLLWSESDSLKLYQEVIKIL